MSLAYLCHVVLCCVAAAHLCRVVLCPVHPGGCLLSSETRDVSKFDKPQVGSFHHVIPPWLSDSGLITAGLNLEQRCSCDVFAKTLHRGRSPEKHRCCWFGTVGSRFRVVITQLNILGQFS